VGASDCLSGVKDFDDSPSYLQHYIKRRVGVKLPQHSVIPKNVYNENIVDLLILCAI
jgi:hypothetical protein